MNALYLILIALCFTAGIWATTLPKDEQIVAAPGTEQQMNNKTDDTKVQENHEPCSTEWSFKKLLAK